MIADRAAFIFANTRLQHPPHVPEVELWLADETTPIWKLTQEAFGQTGARWPFWAFAWAGGQGVARWILDNPEEVRRRRVVDIATGSGLVAIAAMKAGAASALGADIDPFCAAAVEANARANGVEVAFTAENLLDAAPPDADLICAGDVSYEKPMAEAVKAWLERAHRKGARVLLGDPGRRYFDRRGLKHLADYPREPQDVERTGVWTFA